MLGKCGVLITGKYNFNFNRTFTIVLNISATCDGEVMLSRMRSGKIICNGVMKNAHSF
jgi:hypothetical protein